MQELFELIKEECPPAVFSRGIGVAKSSHVYLKSKQSEGDAEGWHWTFVVKGKAGEPSKTVSLWPEQQDFFCSCPQAKNSVCVHAAAAVVAAKNRLYLDNKSLQQNIARIVYHFRYSGNDLYVDMEAVTGTSSQMTRQKITSLLEWQNKGVVSGDELDFKIESFLLQYRHKPMNRGAYVRLFKMLKDKTCEYESAPIKLGPAARGMEFEVVCKTDRITVRLVDNRKNIFKLNPNIGLFEDTLTLLTPFQLPELLTKYSPDLPQNNLKNTVFPVQKLAYLIGELVPALERYFPVRIVRHDSSNQQSPVGIAALSLKPFLKLGLNSRGIKDPKWALQAHIVYGNPELLVLKADSDLTICFAETQGNKRLQRSGEDEKRLVQLFQKVKSDWASKIDILTGGRQAATPMFWMTAASDFLRQLPITPDWQLDRESIFSHTNANQIIDVHEENKEEILQMIMSLNEVAVMDSYGGDGSPIRLFSPENGIMELTFRKPENWQGSFIEFVRCQGYLKSGKSGGDFAIIPKLVEFLRSSVGGFSELSVALDAHKLRSYQIFGVKFLLKAFQNNLGVLVGDEMGLGKTIQIANFLRHGKLQKSIKFKDGNLDCILICPVSLIENWVRELKIWAPEISVNVFHGRNKQFKPNTDVVISSYGTVRKHIERFTEKSWQFAVIDEAQAIKNAESLSAKAVKQLNARFNAALTGTPIENSLDDLKSIFEFVLPDSVYSQSGNIGENIYRSLSLRRRKIEVAAELPEKVESLVPIAMTNFQQDKYLNFRESIVSTWDENDYMGTLTKILRLRQVCLDPRLTNKFSGFEENAEDSISETHKAFPKASYLKEKLISIVENGKKSLIFSSFTGYLDLLEPEIQQLPCSHVRIDGKVKNRQELVDRFQQDESCKIALLTLGAGGVGMNLQAAEWVFLMDPWWNPALENQAIDRAHRIGQKNTVFVERLIMKNSIEESVLALSQSKATVADKFFAMQIHDSKVAGNDANKNATKPEEKMEVLKTILGIS